MRDSPAHRLDLDGQPGRGATTWRPFSQFQNLTFDPPYVMFAANQNTLGKRKDTVVNSEQTGEFVYNMATYDLREAVNRSAAEVPPEVDEFELADVTKAPSLSGSNPVGWPNPRSSSNAATTRPCACPATGSWAPWTWSSAGWSWSTSGTTSSVPTAASTF